MAAFYVGYRHGEVNEHDRMIAKAYSNTVTLADVDVLRRDAPDMYLMQAGVVQFEAKFCPDYKPEWDEGIRLKVLVYEDTGPCKSIRKNDQNRLLGFKVERDDTGRPIKFNGPGGGE